VPSPDLSSAVLQASASAQAGGREAASLRHNESCHNKITPVHINNNYKTTYHITLNKFIYKTYNKEIHKYLNGSTW